MEVWKSRGRFLSILFIVALGVAFFAGLRVTEPDMRLSADAYYDEVKLADIQVIGTMGVTQEDAKAISNLSGVAEVEPGYTKDVLCDMDGKQRVLRVMSLLKNMNQVQLIEGQLPKKADECVLDVDFLEAGAYEIGDKITFTSGDETEIKDSFAEDTFTIVGAVASAEYIAISRGTTTIGNGSVNGFVYVDAEAFDMEVYTQINILVEGAIDEVAYTDAYDEKVDTVIDRIEEIVSTRCKIRRAEVIDQAEIELNDGWEEYNEEREKALQELSNAEKELEEAKILLQDGRSQINDGWKKLQEGKTQLTDGEKTLTTKKAELAEGKQKYQDGLASLETAEAEFATKSAEAEVLFAQAEEQIQAVQDYLDQLKSQYDALMLNPNPTPEELQQAQLIYAAWEQGMAELSEKRNLLASNKAELEENANALKQARQEIDSTASVLASADAQIAEGEKQIVEGWKEVATNEMKLQENEELLLEKEKALAEGEEEFTEKEQEAIEKLDEAEQKLKDAEEEIQDIKTPKWYVKDRSIYVDYAGYGDNANRMGAIAKIFPLLFFLVAALISLTTMTRMVEEQRIQIGTMKALGYGKSAIALKYIGYALFATLLGSILGILVGEKIFPYIIITAYKMMYPHLPNVVIPYHLPYAALATSVALISTLGATWASCYKELKVTPAILMRPPAPMFGKRVLIERVTFLWKRLTFIWKSTIRNLFRYKKRFFMTVFGIGSCMALMIVGFGIKDSIFQIADIQYEEIEHTHGTLYFGEDVSNESQENLYKYIKEQKDVSNGMTIGIDSITLEKEGHDEDVYLYVPKEMESMEDFFTLRDRKSGEEWELPKNGAILSEKIANVLGVKEGDTITIKDEKKGNKQVEIYKICETYMGHKMFMSSEQYRELYGEDAYQNGFLFMLDEYNQERLEELGEEALLYEGVINVQYVKTMRGQLDDMLESLDLVILVLIISAGMLAFVVLYNLNNINITERKRELATIKVLGFYDGEVGAYVFRENALLTGIGVIVGLILGKILHQYIIVTVEIDAMMFGRIIERTSYLYSALWTIGFSLFVNFIMYFKLKKIDMIESLKSIE